MGVGVEFSLHLCEISIFKEKKLELIWVRYPFLVFSGISLAKQLILRLVHFMSNLPSAIVWVAVWGLRFKPFLPWILIISGWVGVWIISSSDPNKEKLHASRRNCVCYHTQNKQYKKYHFFQRKTDFMCWYILYLLFHMMKWSYHLIAAIWWWTCLFGNNRKWVIDRDKDFPIFI